MHKKSLGGGGGGGAKNAPRLDRVKWTEAQYFMDGRFLVIFDSVNIIIFHLIKHNKTDGFTVLCVQFYLNLRLAVVVSFFKIYYKLAIGDVYCYQHL